MKSVLFRMPGGIADRRRGRKHQERGQEERRRLHASQAQDQTQSTGQRIIYSRNNEVIRQLNWPVTQELLFQMG